MLLTQWTAVVTLDRYLAGWGDWIIEDNPRWTSYMQNNASLNRDLRARAEAKAQQLFVGSSSGIVIDKSFSMQIETGEGIVGYQYPHGANANVGDFERDASANNIRHEYGRHRSKSSVFH